MPNDRPTDMSDDEYYWESGYHDAEVERDMKELREAERELVPEGGMSGHYPEDLR